jgi:hypothetical protein
MHNVSSVDTELKSSSLDNQLALSSNVNRYIRLELVRNDYRTYLLLHSTIYLLTLLHLLFSLYRNLKIRNVFFLVCLGQ